MEIKAPAYDRDKREKQHSCYEKEKIIKNKYLRCFSTIAKISQAQASASAENSFFFDFTTTTEKVPNLEI